MCIDPSKVLNGFKTNRYEVLLKPNNKISVKVPFSPEPYEENLVPLDLIQTKLKNFNFTLIDTYDFNSYDLSKLDDEDLKWVSLFTNKIYMKIK
jgi:hypothetical protein